MLVVSDAMSVFATDNSDVKIVTDAMSVFQVTDNLSY